jgi:hypothetical protein
MPRIPDQLLNSVIYLFRNEEDAQAGRGAGGTGFLVELESEAGWLHHYVVSNIHVVRNGCTTLRINTEDGGVSHVEIPESAWVDHPDGDDISVGPIDDDIPSDWTVTPLDWENLCPTPERMEELNVGIGDEVVMLGRFSGHSGRQQNQPLARFGSLAMMDDEKVRDGRGMLIDAFLVEMRSIPGFSGSPVFITIGAGSWRGVYGEAGAQMMPFFSETTGLLGIDTGHKPITNTVLDKTTGQAAEPPMVVEQNSGVAIVSPYYKIRELLEGEELVEQRQRADAEAAADDPGPA